MIQTRSEESGDDKKMKRSRQWLEGVGRQDLVTDRIKGRKCHGKGDF